MLESNQSALALIGVEIDRDVHRIAAFAGRNRIPFRIVEIDRDEAMWLSGLFGIPADRPIVLPGETRVRLS